MDEWWISINHYWLSQRLEFSPGSSDWQDIMLPQNWPVPVFSWTVLYSRGIDSIGEPKKKCKQFCLINLKYIKISNHNTYKPMDICPKNLDLRLAFIHSVIVVYRKGVPWIWLKTHHKYCFIFIYVSQSP